MLLKKPILDFTYKLLGYDRTQDLRNFIRRRRPPFSEMDLVLEGFRDRSEGVMIDVGAHYGTALEPYVMKGWSVHAFEPDPANRAILTTRIDPSRIKVYPFAVSDQECESAPFFASSESSGISSLSAFRRTHEEVAQVKVCTLSKILMEQKINDVTFLKIDTEGHDLFVLRGFPWSNLQPEAILCEFEDGKTLPLGYDYKALGSFLTDQGYKVFLSEWAPILRYGATHQWRSWNAYPCALSDPKGWGNFVAFRMDRKLEFVQNYFRRISNSN